MIPDSFSIDLLDILPYEEKRKRIHTGGRNFSALSFRLEADTRFFFSGREQYAGKNSVTFVPQKLDYDRLNGCSEKIIVFHFTEFSGNTDAITVFSPRDPEKCRKLFEKALKIWQSDDICKKYAATAVFYEIIAELFRTAPADERSGLSEPVRYIRANFRDPDLRVSALCGRFGISDSYFRRQFRLVYGVSPKQFIDDLRIDYARFLLKSGDLSQKEISFRCGYRDVKYFRTAFKNRTGATLSDYRSKTYVFPPESHPQKSSAE